MFGVVVATHGSVSVALREAAEAMTGPIARLATVSVAPGDDPAALSQQLEIALETVDAGHGAMVLVDVLGGTPCNLGLGSTRHAVEVVAGVNLPMLLHVAALRDSGKPLRDAAAELATYGREHIAHASELLRSRRASKPPGGAT